MEGLDWNDLRSFLALSERGSISGRGEVFEREPFNRAAPVRKLEKTVLTPAILGSFPIKEVNSHKGFTRCFG